MPHGQECSLQRRYRPTQGNSCAQDRHRKGVHMITLGKLAASAAASVLCLSFVTTADSANTLIVNPTALAWGANDTAHIADYAKPTGMIVAGRCNRETALIQNARASGAEVLAYIEPVSVPNPPA